MPGRSCSFLSWLMARLLLEGRRGLWQLSVQSLFYFPSLCTQTWKGSLVKQIHKSTKPFQKSIFQTSLYFLFPPFCPQLFWSGKFPSDWIPKSCPWGWMTAATQYKDYTSLVSDVHIFFFFILLFFFPLLQKLEILNIKECLWVVMDARMSPPQFNSQLLGHLPGRFL